METFTVNTTVEILDQGAWIGPFTVRPGKGRTDEHIILFNPANGTIFEHYNDAPYNTRKAV